MQGKILPVVKYIIISLQYLRIYNGGSDYTISVKSEALPTCLTLGVLDVVVGLLPVTILNIFFLHMLSLIYIYLQIWAYPYSIYKPHNWLWDNLGKHHTFLSCFP